MDASDHGIAIIDHVNKRYITIDFDIELNPNTINSDNVKLYLETLDIDNNATYSETPSTIGYSNKKITINPNEDLVAGKTYTIPLNSSIKANHTQKSIHGMTSRHTESWSFVAQ
jgi:hypothetical protein